MKIVRAYKEVAASNPVVSRIVSLIRKQGMRVNKVTPTSIRGFDCFDITIISQLEDGNKTVFVPVYLIAAMNDLFLQRKNFSYEIRFNKSNVKFTTIRIYPARSQNELRKIMAELENSLEFDDKDDEE